MKKKNVQKLIIAVILVMAMVLGALMLSSCKKESASVTKEAPSQTAKAKKTIHWRLQSYAGAALNPYVVGEAIKAFNTAANGEMVIDVYTADELVPQSDLFRAVQEGTVDAIVSDDDSIAAPVDVAIFSAYFPLAAKYGIDVDVLWNYYGLNKIWKDAYDKVKGVTWLSIGSWDPCNFATNKPLRHLKDFKGLRMYMFPTGGQFMKQFGVVPMVLKYEDVQMAIQTGVLDGVAWSGITEDYTVGWADVTKYFLTNPVSGGWAGSWFVNTKSWAKVPDHLKKLYMMTIAKSNYDRLMWYFHGEAYYRVHGKKLILTTIPENEWKQVEKAALKFWDEIAKKSPRDAEVVAILKKYINDMELAGPPYRSTRKEK